MPRLPTCEPVPRTRKWSRPHAHTYSPWPGKERHHGASVLEGIGPDVEWSRVVDTAKRVKRALEGWDLVSLLDTLRYGRGSTDIGPWSARAHAGATVAMPLPWPALTARLDPTKCTVPSLFTGRLAPVPWAGLDEHRARLPAALLRSVPA